jgi:anti-sigma-K factor RskA
MISCEQCRDELTGYALGQAEAAHEAGMREHLAACPVCRQELSEFEAAWAALPLMLEPAAPSPELFDRVLTRIGGQLSRAASNPSSPRLSRRERILSYVVAATVLLALTVGYIRLRSPNEDDAAARRSVEKLAERLGNLQQMERLLQSDRVRLVSLHRPETPASAQAYVIWDMAAGQWHFYASELPAPPAGKQYQLWAADEDGRLLPGPTFDVDAEGLGSAVVDMPHLDPGVAAKAVVTLEPAGGSKEPTGKVYLEAAL